ncbi:hypothetical protein BFS35_007545 [Macrococcoides goetzii]|uniref:Uncharacterized protein n=1 Tax=Macrococcoides goetzii TaxID=1891097 RepID=A0A395GBJ7_9STAP|nr:hypothetical protein BFS35_007545 [Macrococcus goetzii]
MRNKNWGDSDEEPCQIKQNGSIPKKNRAKSSEMARFQVRTVPNQAKWPDSKEEPCQTKRNGPIPKKNRAKSNETPDSK